MEPMGPCVCSKCTCYLFFTHTTVPERVRNLSASLINATTVMIEWKLPEILNGILTQYQITVGREIFITSKALHIILNLGKHLV